MAATVLLRGPGHESHDWRRGCVGIRIAAESSVVVAVRRLAAHDYRLVHVEVYAMDMNTASAAGSRDQGSPAGRRWLRRLVRGLVVVAIVGIVGYSGYIGVVGSGVFTDPSGSTDCRTPQELFGWSYEAINYDPSDDARLRAANPDMTQCTSQGSLAGTDVVTSDGVGIAGWYVPAASGVGPSGPTVVMAHGWSSDKSDILRYGKALHQNYNLVAFDQRNNGRSGGTLTTMGYLEQNDVEAIVDWLVTAKAPVHIGVLANSMGSPAVLAAAARDLRIDAVLLDSAHAHLMNVVARRLLVHEGQTAYPGAWAIVLGTDIRVGADVTSVDPAILIPRLGARPLLLTHGAADRDDLPAESAEVNRAAAEAAGVKVALKYCEGADHGKVVDVCPEAFGQWATAFFDTAFGVIGSAGGNNGSALPTPSPTAIPESTVEPGPTAFALPSPVCPAPSGPVVVPDVLASVGDRPALVATRGSSTFSTCTTTAHEDVVPVEPAVGLAAQPGDVVTLTLPDGWVVLEWEGFDRSATTEGANVWPLTETPARPGSIEIPAPGRAGDSIAGYLLSIERADATVVGQLEIALRITIAGS